MRKRMISFFCFVFGVLLVLILLEAGLWAGMGYFSWKQESANRRALKKGDYRILCLGESTTAIAGDGVKGGTYPEWLQRILNQAVGAEKFSVINKGVVNTNSSLILSRLEEYPEQYKPQMVITMMGINDYGEAREYLTEKDKPRKVFTQLKTCRLVAYLYERLRYKWKDLTDFKRAENLLKAGIDLSSIRKEVSDQAWESFLQSSARQSPEPGEFYHELGKLFQTKGRLREAQESFNKAIEFGVKDPEVFSELSQTHREEIVSESPEEVYLKEIKRNSENFDAYAGIGKYYRTNGKNTLAELAFEKAAAIKPDAPLLAYFYMEEGRYEKARDDFLTLLQNKSADRWYRVKVAEAFMGLKDYSKAITLLQESLKDFPQDTYVISTLAKVTFRLLKSYC